MIRTKPNEKKIGIKTEIFADGDAPKDLELAASVSNWKEGKILASSKKQISIKGNIKADIEIALPEVRVWDVDNPHLYSVTLALHDPKGNILDMQVHRVGIRSFEPRERYFYLNGRPIYIRGVLHWGYYPELLAPIPDENTIRNEIRDMKSLGYNLIKICMFFFPERFYEIADEMGMLVWQEYPVWLKPMRQKNRKALIDEYTEYYLQDRNRTCIVLRDITCENQDVDNSVLKELYDLGKQLVPGAVIEDNSFWGLYDHGDQADFFDCHFYRDNDQLLTHLGKWREFLKKHKASPFVLGECIDTDTFRSLEWLEKKAGKDKHWWLPYCYNAQKKLRTQITAERGEETWKALIPHSYAHSLLTRKFQIETFRRAPETGGYVITSIRDIKPTTPGMYTDSGELKWKSEEWVQFNGDSVLLLSTPGDQFVFKEGEKFQVQLILSHYGKRDITEGVLQWNMKPLDRYKQAFAKIDLTPKLMSSEGINVSKGETKVLVTIPLLAQDVREPVTLRLGVALKDKGGSVTENEWLLWIFPTEKERRYTKEVAIYSKNFADLGWGVKVDDLTKLYKIKVLVTDRLTSDVLSFMKSGGRVVYLAADGKWPRVDLYFWRETVAIMPQHPAMGNFPCDDVIDLQFMSMTQRKMLDVSKFNDNIHNIIEVVNCRKMTRGTLVFETQVGKGALVVSVLQHQGRDNLAGSYLLEQFVKYLLQADKKIAKEFPADKLEIYLDK